MATATMTPTSPKAFLLSATLHVLVILFALLMGYATTRREQELPKVLELVAGEGDNYAAREAPALGVEGGVKLTVPAPATPKPLPVEPAAIAPPPPPVAPATKATAPAADAVPNFKKKIQYAIVRGDAEAKRQLKKEREAEAKRLAEEKKRLTKEEFDRAQKNNSAPTKVASAKVPAIDGKGIAKGVVGGSTNNIVGGAGGKALRSDNDDVLGAYFSLFKQKLRAAFEPPPGLSDSLKVEIQVRSNSDGTLNAATVLRSSGSKEFDQAVLAAISRVRMPSRPDKKGELVKFEFSMHERDDG